MKKTTFAKWAFIATLALITSFVYAQTKQNFVTDSSFESGKLGEWVLDGENASCFVEENKDNAHSGKFTYKYWKDKAFKSTLKRKIKGLQNGTYILSIWAMGGGGENEIRFFAENFDASGKQVSVQVKNTGWQKWKKYSIEVPVQNGEVTIGIFLNANAGNWGNFDDVTLEKK
ncbi:MAG: carbohydrate binding domain-containing protein [Treponema sp.]